MSTGLPPDRYGRTDQQRFVDACPNCGGPSRLVRNDDRIVWPKITSNRAPLLKPYVSEEVWTCVVCSQSMLRLVIYDQGDNQDRDPVELREVWPDRPPRTLPESAPDLVASLYREASIAEHAGALRGAAALYRASLEQLLDALEISEGNLRRRVEALAERGVSDDVILNCHEARLLGNFSLHDGIAFSPEEVADVADLVAEAVNELYVIPAEREAMRAARAARGKS
jgi:Domain of unknown function (DUF4145)